MCSKSVINVNNSLYSALLYPKSIKPQWVGLNVECWTPPHSASCSQVFLQTLTSLLYTVSSKSHLNMNILEQSPQHGYSWARRQHCTFCLENKAQTHKQCDCRSPPSHLELLKRILKPVKQTLTRSQLILCGMFLIFLTLKIDQRQTLTRALSPRKTGGVTTWWSFRRFS